jgi:hypothetical protein
MLRDTINTSSHDIQYACKLSYHQQCRVGEQTTASTIYSSIKIATTKPTCKHNLLASDDMKVEQAPTCLT